MAFDGRLLGGVSVLAAVVETGNFVRAAEALGLTPSGVSRAVARLEARVGVRLLDRTPRAVSLTSEPEPSNLIARKLLETRILTCAAPDYLARHGRPQHPRDLAQHECLLFRDPVTGRPFAWEFHRAGKVVQVKVNGRLIFNDLATKLTACAAGHGISQTLEFGLDALVASGELVQILVDWAEERFPLYAYHPSRNLPPAKVRAFLDFVLASIAPSTSSRKVTAKSSRKVRQTKS